MHALIAVVHVVILHVPLVGALLGHVRVVKPVAWSGGRAPFQAVGSGCMVQRNIFDVLVDPIPLQHTSRLTNSSGAPVLHAVEHSVARSQWHLEKSRGQTQKIDPCFLGIARRGHALDQMIAVEGRTVSYTGVAALTVLALGWGGVLAPPARNVALHGAAEGAGVDFLGILGAIVAKHSRKPGALAGLAVEPAIPPTARSDPLHSLYHVGRMQLRCEFLLGLRSHRKQNIVKEAQVR
mmetsp:Transcript_3173/g.7144  ORF Transcript_3173/g.7144 Transcript_3173/m.7144 type:complete len:237 (+) Transcript_3173:777-1487(+)